MKRQVLIIVLMVSFALISISANDDKETIKAQISNVFTLPEFSQEAMFCPHNQKYIYIGNGIYNTSVNKLTEFKKEDRPMGWIDDKYILVRNNNKQEIGIYSMESLRPVDIKLKLSKIINPYRDVKLKKDSVLNLHLKKEDVINLPNKYFRFTGENISSYYVKRDTIYDREGNIIYHKKNGIISGVRVSQDKKLLKFRLSLSNRILILNTVTKETYEIPSVLKDADGTPTSPFYYWLPGNTSLLAFKETLKKNSDVCKKDELFIYSIVNKDMVKISLPDEIEGKCIHVRDISNKGLILINLEFDSKKHYVISPDYAEYYE